MITTLSDRDRVAAHGRHRCGFCGNRIAVGEKYNDSRVADMGTVWTFRAHLRCIAFLHEVVDPIDWEDGIDYPIFADYVAENPEAAERHGVAR
jgi:hypothetical protein